MSNSGRKKRYMARARTGMAATTGVRKLCRTWSKPGHWYALQPYVVTTLTLELPVSAVRASFAGVREYDVG